MPEAITPQCSGNSEKYSSAQTDQPSHRDVWEDPPGEHQGKYRTEHRTTNEAHPELESVTWRIKTH